MATRTLWVGLDVGDREMAVCATDYVGSVVLEQSVATSAAEFHRLLRRDKRRIKLIGMESSLSAIPLTRSLRRLGYRVAVFDSRQASRFLAVRQNKTDKNDARGLAELARVARSSVSEVRVKGQECQRLKSTLVTRQRLVSMRMTIDGSLRALLRLNGGRLKSSSSAAVLRRNVEQEVGAIRKATKLDLSDDVDPLLELGEAIRNYVEALDDKLTQLAKEHPVCRNFLEIPGVGPLCALSLYSVVEDPFRFKRSADIGPYLGMVPRVRQSGQSTRICRISRRGDAMTRSYLSNAAINHLRFGSSAISDWGARLLERTTARRAQIAIARKLAVVMIAMWKSGQPYTPHHESRVSLVA